MHSGEEWIADTQRARFDEHRCDGTTSLVEARFDDDAARWLVRICFEIKQFSFEGQHFEQLTDSLSGLRRNLDSLRFAAELFDDDVVLRQLLLDLRGICRWKIDLVDRDENRDVRRSGVVDRFDGLRHDRVVCRDNQYDDVGYLRTTSTHGGERFVTRGIEERNATIRRFDFVCTDVLRDATRFVTDDVGFPYVVEKRRLTVVDVSHDGDNRMPRLEVFRKIFFLDDLFGFLFFHLLDFEVQLIGDNGNRIPIEALVE